MVKLLIGLSILFTLIFLLRVIYMEFKLMKSKRRLVEIEREEEILEDEKEFKARKTALNRKRAKTV